MTAETEEKQYPKYVIYPEWHRQKGRSLAILLRDRARLLGGQNIEKELKKGDEGAIFSAISKRCKGKPDFIPPDLPVMEAVFRIFLAGGNQPLTPAEVSERLARWWKEIGPYKDLDPHILGRLLSADRYYGFRAVEEAEA